MAATVSGSKTVTVAAHPALTAATLTDLMAIAPENLTIDQFRQIEDAINRVSGGHAGGTKIGALLT